MEQMEEKKPHGNRIALRGKRNAAKPADKVGIKVSFRFTRDLIEAISNESEKLGITKTELLKLAIREFINNKKGENNGEIQQDKVRLDGN